LLLLLLLPVWRYQHVAPIWSLPFLRILIMLVSPEVIWLFTFLTFAYAKKDLRALIKPMSALPQSTSLLTPTPTPTPTLNPMPMLNSGRND